MVRFLNLLKQKNNAEQEMQRGVPKRSLANATSSASNVIIVENAEKVNPSSKFYSLMETKNTEVVKTPALPV